ncbi:MAG TPA: FkbM family methyltransferase [Alphaproteobacteria bacterium]|nr:FkbM family methyltransferase [Alphaproteobacteria bacterium]
MTAGIRPFSRQGGLLMLRRLTRALAAVPGGVRCLHLGRYVLPKPKAPITIADFDGDLTMTLRLDEHMQGFIFWNGGYNRDLARLLDRILRPGMTVIDAGANVGEITLLAAKRVAPDGVVVAFEPVREIADTLSANLAANGFSHAVVRMMALSDAEGALPIYRAREPIRDGSINDGMGSLFIGDRDLVEAGTIPVSTLDHQVAELGLAKVDVIKMDIEGAELPALRGAEAVLRRDRPVLIVEVQEETARAAGYAAVDLFAYLARLGYRFDTIQVDGGVRPLDQGQLKPIQNVLCVPVGRGDVG